MFNNIEDYLEKLTNIIPENNEEIFNKILNILCEIAKYDESFTFLIISLLIKKLEKSPNLINIYGISMLKILSTAIPITTIYLTITDILLKHNEINFIIGMVNILDIFLLTEDGSEKVRIKLNKFNTKERKGDDFKFFNQIFNLLSYKPISALMMCIISNYYELSFYLALELANMDLEIDDYFQLNQMIQLIESSLFHHIRIKLLNPNKNIFLIKTLYAILIILPRGHAFTALNNRLKSLKIISYLNDDQNLISKENAKDNLKLDEDIKKEVNSFIKIFKERQDIKNYK
jgi:vacuole morphology and inheritance protein 14